MPIHQTYEEIEMAVSMDEQRAGRSALWHHGHSLSPTEKGVFMTDHVTYRLPGGPLGTMAHRIFLQKQLKGIFRYGELGLEKKFGQP